MKTKKYSMKFILKHTIPRIFCIRPLQFIFLYVCFALTGILMALSTPCTQILFDGIVALAENRVDVIYAIGMAVLLFCVKILGQFFSYVGNFIGESYDLRSYQVLYAQIHEQCSVFNTLDYEKAEILKSLKQAQNGVRSVVHFVNIFMDILVNYLSYFVVMILYFVHLNPLLILILVIIFTTVVMEQIVKSKVYTEEEETVSALQLRMDYYDTCVSDRRIAKETRSLGAFRFFFNKLDDCLAFSRKCRKESNRKVTGIAFVINLAILLEYVCIILLMTFFMFSGLLSAGAFVAIFVSVDEIFNMIENLVGGRLGDCAENYGKVRNYLDFIYGQKIKPLKISYRQMGETAIRLSHISFRYPDSGKNVLTNISMEIKKNETIAIVGENGSGKSTLVKLLLGLYEPLEGEVWFHQENEPLRRQLTAVFQDFQKYPFSIKENIEISDYEFKNPNYEEILVKVGLKEKVDGLAQGDNTKLFNEFGGADLSGGEWQKVSIARSLYRRHHIIILDEPSSALDPLSEIQMYKNLEEMVQGKTAVVVTHRLGSVKFADKIAVMRYGKLLGFGAHEELLKSCGYYRELWEGLN